MRSPISLRPLPALLALALGLSACATAQPTGEVPHPVAPDDAPEVAPPAPEVGYDLMLTNMDYPFDIGHIDVSIQGQDLTMAYMDVAPEGEPRGAVLLLHGKNFSGAYWEGTIRALREGGYRVIVPDQVGFGKSAKPTDIQYSFHLLAQNTAQLLDALGVADVHVVGHSMGGMLAARFALMFPRRMDSLTLVNPIGLEDWKRKVPYQSVDAWTEAEMKKTPEGVKAYMTQSYFDGVWKEAYAPLVDLQAGWVMGPDWPHLARVSALTYDMIFTQPVIYEFEQITAPTLLVIGQRDKTALGKGSVPDEIAATLGDYPALGRSAAEALPNATLVPLQGIGHIPQYEATEAWLGALTGFLDAQTQGSPAP